MRRQPALEKVVVGRILAALKKTRAARYLLEEITPTLVMVREGAEEKLLEALSEAGYLGEARLGR